MLDNRVTHTFSAFLRRANVDASSTDEAPGANIQAGIAALKGELQLAWEGYRRHKTVFAPSHVVAQDRERTQRERGGGGGGEAQGEGRGEPRQMGGCVMRRSDRFAY